MVVLLRLRFRAGKGQTHLQGRSSTGRNTHTHTDTPTPIEPDGGSNWIRLQGAKSKKRTRVSRGEQEPAAAAAAAAATNEGHRFLRIAPHLERVSRVSLHANGKLDFGRRHLRLPKYGWSYSCCRPRFCSPLCGVGACHRHVSHVHGRPERTTDEEHQILEVICNGASKTARNTGRDARYTMWRTSRCAFPERRLMENFLPSSMPSSSPKEEAKV